MARSVASKSVGGVRFRISCWIVLASLFVVPRMLGAERVRCNAGDVYRERVRVADEILAEALRGIDELPRVYAEDKPEMRERAQKNRDDAVTRARMGRDECDAACRKENDAIAKREQEETRKEQEALSKRRAEESKAEYARRKAEVDAIVDKVGAAFEKVKADADADTAKRDSERKQRQAEWEAEYQQRRPARYAEDERRNADGGATNTPGGETGIEMPTATDAAEEVYQGVKEYQEETGYKPRSRLTAPVMTGKEYVDDAQERVDPARPIAKYGAALVERIGRDVETQLTLPAAAPDRSSSPLPRFPGHRASPRVNAPSEPQWTYPLETPNSQPLLPPPDLQAEVQRARERQERDERERQEREEQEARKRRIEEMERVVAPRRKNAGEEQWDGRDPFQDAPRWDDADPFAPAKPQPGWEKMLEEF